MYSYLTDRGQVGWKAKGTKKYVIKREIKFQDYKTRLKNNRTILRTQQRFRSEAHNVFTEKVNKISLSANGGKRMQKPDGVTTYFYGYGC